jgi:hypothetical protein
VAVGQRSERFKVKSDELLKRLKEILHEGNVRHVVIRQGSRTVAEFPVTVGVVAAVVAPMLAALGAGAALVTECTIEVVREESPAPKTAPRGPSRRKKT